MQGGILGFVGQQSRHHRLGVAGLRGRRGRPVEFSAQFSRTRADGEWGTSASPKVKTNIVPTAIGSWGFAISAIASYDLLTKENTALFVNIPATLRVSNVVRINLNAGWQLDRTTNRNYFIYGAGFDWRTPDNIWTLTGEVFGQAGFAEDPASSGHAFSSGCATGRSISSTST